MLISFNCSFNSPRDLSLVVWRVTSTTKILSIPTGRMLCIGTTDRQCIVCGCAGADLTLVPRLVVEWRRVSWKLQSVTQTLVYATHWPWHFLNTIYSCACCQQYRTYFHLIWYALTICSSIRNQIVSKWVMLSSLQTISILAFLYRECQFTVSKLQLRL